MATRIGLLSKKTSGIKVKKGEEKKKNRDEFAGVISTAGKMDRLIRGVFEGVIGFEMLINC